MPKKVSKEDVKRFSFPNRFTSRDVSLPETSTPSSFCQVLRYLDDKALCAEYSIADAG